MHEHSKFTHNPFGSPPKIRLELLSRTALKTILLIYYIALVLKIILALKDREYRWACQNSCGGTHGCAEFISSSNNSECWRNGAVTLSPLNQNYFIGFVFKRPNVNHTISYKAHFHTQVSGNSPVSQIHEITCRAGHHFCSMALLDHGIVHMESTLKVAINASFYPNTTDVSPIVTFWFHNPLYTMAEIGIRYFLLLTVTLLAINFAFEIFHTPFAEWMPEQMWCLFLLLAFVCYVNPFYAPSLYHRNVENNFSDRVYYIFEVCFRRYAVFTSRATEAIILFSCSFTDSAGFWIGKKRIFIPTVCVAAWLATLISIDIARVNRHGFNFFALTLEQISFSRARTIADDEDTADLELAETVVFIFGIIIILALVVYAYWTLHKQPYLQTRYRQLTFRFFLFLNLNSLLVWTAIQIWGFVFEESGDANPFYSITQQFTTPITDIIEFVCYVCIICYAYIPATRKRTLNLPGPAQRLWTRVQWPKSWTKWVNRHGRSLYFFLYLQEKEHYDSTQVCQQHRSVTVLDRMKASVEKTLNTIATGISKIGFGGRHDVAAATLNKRRDSGNANEPFTPQKVSRTFVESFDGDQDHPDCDIRPSEVVNEPFMEPIFIQKQTLVVGGEAESFSNPLPPVRKRTSVYEAMEPVAPSGHHHSFNNLLLAGSEILLPDNDVSEMSHLPRRTLSTLHQSAEADARHSGASMFCLELAVTLFNLSWESYMLEEPYLASPAMAVAFAALPHRRVMSSKKGYITYYDKEKNARGTAKRRHSLGKDQMTNISFALHDDIAMMGTLRQPDDATEKPRDKSLMDVEQFGFTLHAVIKSPENPPVLQCILASNDKMIVVAFRGTANMKNLLTDFKFLPRKMLAMAEEFISKVQNAKVTKPNMSDVAHGLWGCLVSFWRWLTILADNIRGIFGFDTPRCHSGFLEAYNTLKDPVLHAVNTVLSDPNDKRPIVCTGHSLGGAMATHAAYDFAMKYELKRSVSMYNFGSPRVGNSKYQKMYDLLVPDSYRIVSDGDFITSTPPQFSLIGSWFRHIGTTILLDTKGNMIIQPTIMEDIFSPFSSFNVSVEGHQMASYASGLNRLCEVYSVFKAGPRINEGDPSELLSCLRDATPES